MRPTSNFDSFEPKRTAFGGALTVIVRKGLKGMSPLFEELLNASRSVARLEKMMPDDYKYEVIHRSSVTYYETPKKCGLLLQSIPTDSQWLATPPVLVKPPTAAVTERGERETAC